MTQLVKVSDYVANFFLEKGINTCFSVTGGGAMHLNDSFGHHPEYCTVYNHHEQACAMAAEGYTRISNKPAIVCVTSGPGATNAMTGVLGAWLDSIPMIVLSGQMKVETTLHSVPFQLRQLGFQEFNIVDSVSAMTKYAAMVTDVRYIKYHLERAFFEATQGRKGPIWLDIPLDIQGAKIDPDKQIRYDFSDGALEQVYESKVRTALVDSVISRINQAKRPVLMVGSGVHHDAARKLLQQTIHKLQIPVVTEWNAEDLIDSDDAFYCGRPGTIGDRPGNFVVQNADLLLFVGCQLSIRQISYAWDQFAPQAYKIGVNVDAYELAKPTVKLDKPIHCNVHDFLAAIIASLVTSVHSPKSLWYQWCRSVKEKYPVVLPEYLSGSGPMNVYAFFDALSNAMPPKSTVVLGNGAACVCGLQTLQVRGGTRIFTNAGASSMGYGIAAAIGACFSKSESDGCSSGTVICIEGDGSIQMNIQELQTIKHHHLNAKIFWLNNGGYHSIRQTQIQMFDGKQRGYCGADASSGLSFPSAAGIAAGYGIRYFKIDAVSALHDTLSEVIQVEGPLICEVIVDPDQVWMPKLQSKMLADGTFSTPPLDDMYPFLNETEIHVLRQSARMIS
jgi:acetolactate synthase I/II/III large subunit